MVAMDAVAMLWITLLISCLVPLRAQQLSGDVTSVVEQGTTCASEGAGALRLTCPAGHMVVLRSAKYFRSLEPGCNTRSTSICEVGDVRFPWFYSCLFKSECDITLATTFTPNMCSGYRGDTFLTYTYRCEEPIEQAFTSNTRDMCDMRTAWQGSHLFLINQNYPRFDQDRDCGCVVSSHAQLEITLAHFQGTSGACKQRFRLQSGLEEQTICSEEHVADYQAVDMTYEGDVHFKVENDEEEDLSFIVVVQTHHKANVTVECSRDYAMPLALTSTQVVRGIADQTTSAITPARHQARQHSSDMEVHWPIITGITGVICVTLVISIAILIFCKRQHKGKRGSSPQLAFDNNVYFSSKQAAASKNQTIINMNSIDKVHTPKHKRVTSHSKATPIKPEVSDRKLSERGQEEMGFQIETSLPLDDQGTIIERARKSNPTLLRDVTEKTLGQLVHSYPDIPEAVLRELSGQSEATIAITHPYTSQQRASNKPSVKSNLASLAANPKVQSKVNERTPEAAADVTPTDVTSDDVTPYCSMSDLSVKDKVKLMSQQLKSASD